MRSVSLEAIRSSSLRMKRCRRSLHLSCQTGRRVSWTRSIRLKPRSSGICLRGRVRSVGYISIYMGLSSRLLLILRTSNTATGTKPSIAPPSGLQLSPPPNSSMEAASNNNSERKTNKGINRCWDPSSSQEVSRSTTSLAARTSNGSSSRRS